MDSLFILHVTINFFLIVPYLLVHRAMLTIAMRESGYPGDSTRLRIHAPHFRADLSKMCTRAGMHVDGWQCRLNWGRNENFLERIKCAVSWSAEARKLCEDAPESMGGAGLRSRRAKTGGSLPPRRNYKAGREKHTVESKYIISHLRSS